mmetsp:Transcript_15404/g.50621  ORF Transcript_15404/g.50621 Transcript_15404/m.50621 type:complete len:303 (-) Transcript_15404:94-1002(-)
MIERVKGLVHKLDIFANKPRQPTLRGVLVFLLAVAPGFAIFAILATQEYLDPPVMEKVTQQWSGEEVGGPLLPVKLAVRGADGGSCVLLQRMCPRVAGAGGAGSCRAAELDEEFELQFCQSLQRDYHLSFACTDGVELVVRSEVPTDSGPVTVEIPAAQGIQFVNYVQTQVEYELAGEEWFVMRTSEQRPSGVLERFEGAECSGPATEAPEPAAVGTIAMLPQWTLVERHTSYPLVTLLGTLGGAYSMCACLGLIIFKVVDKIHETMREEAASTRTQETALKREEDGSLAMAINSTNPLYPR